MKTLKLIILFVISIVFPVALQAGNPSNMKAEDRAKVIVEKLCKDVALTDSQKVAIKIKAKEYTTKMQDAIQSINDEEKNSMKNMAITAYKLALDSLLTKDQKEQFAIKREERKQAIINKYKTKK